MIGPRRVTLAVCDGCPALHTKQLHATSPYHQARCKEAGERLISSMRQTYEAPPYWCPAVTPLFQPATAAPRIPA